MTVYVDNAEWSGRLGPRYHITATTLDELHTFAQGLQLERGRFKGKHPYAYYHIGEWERYAALRNHAQAVTSRELFKHAKLCRASA